MYFEMKNTLKNNYYCTFKHTCIIKKIKIKTKQIKIQKQLKQKSY
jgi:hypothetical protein